MKTKQIILIASISAAAIAGCQKLTEDPKASLTPNTYFKSQSDLDASVASIYQVLTPDYAWGFTNKMTSYFGSDDLTTDPGLNKGDFRAFDQLNGSSANGSLVAEWQAPWTAIYQANNVLANYQKVNSTDVLKQQSAGQALFLRALGYYYLVRTFGSVPLIDKPIDVNDRPDRAPVADIYNLIVNDLKTAKRFLPVKMDQPGRVNQMAARALLADVYLTMAGWPLKNTTTYALAATEADTVIRTGGYTLVADYAKVFTTNNNSESVFALQFNVGGGSPQRAYGSTCVPLDEVASDGSSGWDDFYPEINFYQNAPKCARTDATFYTTLKLKQSDNSFQLVPWNSPQTHAGHPYYKKFRAAVGDGVKETATAIQSINPSTNKTTDIIRYAQVLLDYAEAAAMAQNAPTSQAYDAVNQVRRRAGLPDLTTGLSATAFRDSVVRERAYEFAGEFGMRWFDIVRLQLLPQVTAARGNSENPLATGGDVNNRYLAPIPVNEMLRNPNWKQNPGY